MDDYDGSAIVKQMGKRWTVQCRFTIERPASGARGTWGGRFEVLGGTGGPVADDATLILPGGYSAQIIIDPVPPSGEYRSFSGRQAPPS